MSSNGSPATLIRTAFLIAIFNAVMPTVSAAQPIVMPPTPFFLEMVNPCTGELIVLNGKIGSVIYTRFGNNGGAHLLTRAAAHGIGETVVPPAIGPGAITPAGTKYVMSTENVDESYFPFFPTDFREMTVVINQVWVRQAEDPSAMLPTATDDDFRIKTTFHLTRNANGVLIPEVFHEHATCPTAPAP